jgi:hypothetical protein
MRMRIAGSGSSSSLSEGAGDGSHVIICSAAGVGCAGRLRLLLTWRSAAQLHPDISADLALDPLQARDLLWVFDTPCGLQSVERLELV